MRETVEKIFWDRILAFNKSFAMASFGTSKGHGIISGSGPPSFYLSGAVFHRIGTLAPGPADDPVFAQILFLAPTERIEARRRFNGPPEEVRRLDSAYQQIVPVLDGMLQLHNSRVKLFLMAQEFMNSKASHMYQLRLLAPRNRDPRTYNLPTQEEVAVILPGDDTEYRSSRREIVVRLRHPPNNDSSRIQLIHNGHPALMAVTYPLLLPYGKDWYHNRIPLSQNAIATEAARRVRDKNGVLQRTTDNANANPQTGTAGSKHVTQSQFNTYYFHIRPHNISYPTLFLGGRLFQKFVADAWAMTEQEWLYWMRANQKKLRAKEYLSLQASLAEGLDPAQIGKRGILPSSHTGSPCQMIQLYQDAMAIVRVFGAPDIFITMTCNPAWSEIVNALLPGQTASDRPDIVTRVFHGKLKALLADVLGDGCAPGVFGKVIAYVYVVKFQKRGLPHAHILFIMDPEDKPKTNDDYDKIVTAEIPDRDKFPALFETITNSMLHRRCDRPGNHTCHDKHGKCTKRFPKRLQPCTTSEDGGYPHYRCRGIHQYVKFPGTAQEEVYTDANVVPTNPFLASKYNCHVNVEIASGVAVIKYLYKYVYKGHDRTSFTIDEPGAQDEINNFLDARYVCAPEAIHRIFRFGMHDRDPAVARLALHLPNEQQVRFNPDHGAPDLSAPPETMLTAFIKLCAKTPPDFNAQGLLYADVPTRFRWNSEDRAWVPRKRDNRTIGRIFFCGPEGGERYYLRLLLLKVPSPTTSAHLRTFNCVEFRTFREACVKRGLLRNDVEANRCLTKAVIFRTGHKLRHLFAMLLTADDGVTNAAQLWTRHYDNLTQDVKYHLRNQRQQMMITPEHVANWGLLQLNNILQRLDSSLADHGLPLPTIHFDDEAATNRLILEESATPAELHEMDALWRKNIELCNTEQRIVVETVLDSILNNRGKVFFIDAPGGTGKTFLEITILAQIRSEGKYALVVASSGIAALLLSKGRTAHSRFKIPIDIFDESTCNVPKQGQLAELF
ncbi:BQ5605_C017g08389 [Microbotryum silenes-dioicae]|uniref:ATP-dependent DNA helicase n=1 Tax=Microbotryum silenes-dioicae TaxID=796604 RepID=A0A2X0MGB2_9BASI|nr:BQ5605_C017g08389 [Microbotryum silenes-dioicae]